MSGKKGMKHYSKDIKLRAVQLCLEEGKTHRQAAEALGLPRLELVERWVQRYRRAGEQGFSATVGRPRKDPETPAVYLARLEMENGLLKKYLTELRKTWLARRDIGRSNTTEAPIQ